MPLAPFLLVAALGSAGDSLESPRVERRLSSMGTTLDLSVEAVRRADALEASEAAVRALEAAETRLSTWREESELSRLNRAPVGEAVRLSIELRRDLEAAAKYATETRGAFDPGVGSLVDAWGLRSGGRRPTEAEISRALDASGIRWLTLRDGLAVRRHAGLRIEEGGFGKGAGLDEAVAALRLSRATRAVVDLGGQIAFFSAAGEEPRWFPVAVADPRDRSKAAIRVEISEGSLSTTGNSERSVVIGHERVGHVLSPFDGRPCADFGSVTVHAPDATAADSLSTGLFVLGPDAALEWSRNREGVSVVVLEPVPSGLRCRVSGTLGARIRALAEDVEIELAAPTPPGAPIDPSRAPLPFGRS